MTTTTTDPNRVRNPCWQLMHLLSGLSAFFGKTHCYPTQTTILRLLKRDYSVSMSVRTLNRHLGTIADRLYFRRIPRKLHHKTKGFTFRSTVYVVGARWSRVMLKTIQAAMRWSKIPAQSITVFQMPKLADYRQINI